jgi:hypothetical protein
VEDGEELPRCCGETNPSTSREGIRELADDGKKAVDENGEKSLLHRQQWSGRGCVAG